MKKIDWRIIITIVLCITAIEIYALSIGINGILLTAVIAGLLGLAGWTAPQLNLTGKA